MKLQPPLRTVFLAYKNLRLRRFLAQATNARQVQRQVLLKKIARAAKSEFGRKHGFAGIRTTDDFRRQLPISTYEDYRPYIERVMEGDVEAMFPPGTRILMFAMTSGTTAKPKHLPVTEDFYREYRESWNLWGTGVYNDYRELLSRKTLQLSSDWRTSLAPSGVPCGNISGLAAETRPFYMRQLFALPSATNRVPDAAAKHYLSLRLAIVQRSVGLMITANPSTLVEFARRGDSDRESLIRDIFDGGVSRQYAIPAAIRTALRWRLRPNQKRARELEAIADRHDSLLPCRYWPGLKMLAVWTGGSVGIYLSQLEQYYGKTAIRDHGISASEGRMSIPLVDGSAAGILDFMHNYFEFIPEEEHGTAQPPVLEAHELEPGKNYFILLTTSAGLYRYDIHDMVRCVGYEGEAPLLVFLNKGKHYSSITGEKLSEHQVVTAVTVAFKDLALPSATFTLAPALEDRPVYELLVEKGVASGRTKELATAVQRHLAQQNCEYSDKCASGRIKPLRVRELPVGTWSALRAARSAERGNFEEFKHPCLVGDLDFVERLPVTDPPLSAAS